MRFVGVDLHKQTITVVVVDAARKLLFRKRFSNLMSEQIVAFLKSLGEFQLTVEATASYEWFVQSRRVCEVFGTHHARSSLHSGEAQTVAGEAATVSGGAQQLTGWPCWRLLRSLDRPLFGRLGTNCKEESWLATRNASPRTPKQCHTGSCSRIKPGHAARCFLWLRSQLEASWERNHNSLSYRIVVS